MKIDRRPILATLAIAVALSLAACVDPFEPEGDPPVEEPEEIPTDFRAGQVSSGSLLVRLPLSVTNG